MKNNIIYITIFCCLCQLGLSQNFTGEIKYITSIPKLNTIDTMIYYFDKDLVLVKNTGESVKHGGFLYDIFILYENKFYLFYPNQNNWSEFIQDIDKHPVKIKLDSIGTESVAGYSCKVYEFQTSLKNEYIESNANHTLSISENILFNIPSNFSLENHLFANGTGKVALKSTLSGKTISEVVQFIRTKSS